MLQESKANDSSVDCVRMETETHFNLATYYIAMKWMSKAGGRHFIFATSLTWSQSISRNSVG